LHVGSRVAIPTGADAATPTVRGRQEAPHLEGKMTMTGELAPSNQEDMRRRHRLHTQQGQPDTNQDAMVVWEVSCRQLPFFFLDSHHTVLTWHDFFLVVMQFFFG
jgi:hypothetical protein